jgi:hypothetical protein
MTEVNHCSSARDRIFRHTSREHFMMNFFSHKAPEPSPDDRPPLVPDPEPDEDPVPDPDPV